MIKLASFKLQAIAFSTQLVAILRKGLRTYDSPRYRHFGQRIARLIKLCLEYVTDIWTVLQTQPQFEADPSLRARIQTEFDQFFAKTVNSLHASRKNGAWLCMTALPFGSVSLEVLKKIYLSLHVIESDEMMQGVKGKVGK